ncbi:MAG: hypothetical protein NC094_12275 [Bacteroidales bacterium]|nr:hypothetical protein [Lachnoclostridium sp.]MCM1385376.1 hypothetical protein [Lachnoclostridium sp.]MCM1466186.1 hypothetical protein [Bacteroidales bacterium]
MKFPFLASFFIFIIVLSRRIHLLRNRQESEEKAFWKREQQANTVRRKSLDHLDYIQIPLEKLPTHLMTDDPTVCDCLAILENLSTLKIVNLTGYTNTDLKLEYGAANISALSEYDQNYTLLASTLQKWADVLWNADYRKEAVSIMEFALETHTDVSACYYKLAEYYHARGEDSRISTLIKTAEDLRSLNGNIIVRTLKKSYP